MSDSPKQCKGLPDLADLVLKYYWLKGEYFSLASNGVWRRDYSFERIYLDKVPFSDLIMKYGFQGVSMQIPSLEIENAAETLDKMENALIDIFRKLPKSI